MSFIVFFEIERFFAEKHKPRTSNDKFYESPSTTANKDLNFRSQKNLNARGGRAGVKFVS